MTTRFIRAGTTRIDADHIAGFASHPAPTIGPDGQITTRHHVVALVQHYGAVCLDDFPTEAGATGYLDQLERELADHKAKSTP